MIEDEKVGDEVLMIGVGQARGLRLFFHIGCGRMLFFSALPLPFPALLSHIPVHSRS